MDRIKQMALAQKAKFLETLNANTSILHSIIEGDKRVTKVVVNGDPPSTDNNNSATNNNSGEGSDDSRYSTEMVCAILRAVEESKVVTHLHISNRSDAQEFISSFTPVLSKNMILKFVALSNVDIGDDLSMPLFGALAKNTSIETVTFSNIGLTTVQGLMLLLKHTHALRCIDLSNNTFSEEAFFALADGLRLVSSTELKEIRLLNTGLTDAALARICSVLEESVEYCPSLRAIDYGTSSSDEITDATRLRVITAIDHRITRAAEIARGMNVATSTTAAPAVNSLKASDKGSDRASNPSNPAFSGGMLNARGSDNRSDRGSAGETDASSVGPATTPASVGATTTINDGHTTIRSPPSNSPKQTYEAAPTFPPQGASPSEESKLPPIAAAPPAAVPQAPPTTAGNFVTAGITQADVNLAVNTAVSAANAQHELKISKLAELLGDSQTQATRLQEELQMRNEKISDLQNGTKAIKEASKAMHLQFQLRVKDAEATAADQLKEASAVIAALNARLEKLTTLSNQQKQSFEESIRKEREAVETLKAENKVLREEYITELKAAIKAQQEAAEAARDAPPRGSLDAEAQTDPVAIADEEGGSSSSLGGRVKSFRKGSAPPNSATPPSSKKGAAAAAAAYEDAVSGFALVDAEEAEDETGSSRWRKDEDVSHCTTCMKEFTTLTRRRHHCRRCGGIFCGDCVTKSKVDSKVVCNNCSRSEAVLIAGNAKK